MRRRYSKKRRICFRIGIILLLGVIVIGFLKRTERKKNTAWHIRENVEKKKKEIFFLEEQIETLFHRESHRVKEERG
ncbi:hypothetical protein FUSNEC_GEN_295_03140 [Fusobacterium necrophorum subsp. funduliforme]|uniref:hypothetical protein n=1 Tax=Fusobacterium TaxID=848 RepID=UPI002F428729